MDTSDDFFNSTRSTTLKPTEELRRKTQTTQQPEATQEMEEGLEDNKTKIDDTNLNKIENLSPNRPCFLLMK